MDEAPQHAIGEIVDGRRWTGSAWEPVAAPVTAAEPAATTAPGTVGSGAGFVEDPSAYWAPRPAASAVPAAAGGGTSGDAVRAAAPMFLLGVAVAVGVSIAGIVVVNSRGGGILWWGGYFVTFGLWRAAKARYDAASRQSGGSMSGGVKALTALGLVVAIGSAAAFGLTYINAKSAPALPETVGSCWQEKDSKAFVVDCSSTDAQYTAIATAATQDACPQEAVASVETATPGQLLCLAQK